MKYKGKIIGLILTAFAILGFVSIPSEAEVQLKRDRAEFKEEMAQILDEEVIINYGEDTQLKLPKDVELLSYYKDDYSKPGEYKEVVIASKNEEVSMSGVRNVKVVDKIAPKIKGVRNLSIYAGEEVSIGSGITAYDEIDGDVSVSVEGNYNSNEVGTYSLKAVAKDSSGNVAEEPFTLTVKKTPVNTIYFHKTGATIPYVAGHSSVSVVQPIIDNNPWTATVWSYFDGRPNHSNTDGKGTYFIGHASHAFQSAMYMNIGEKITVWDGTGNSRVYTVTNRIVGGSSISDASNAYHSGSGEFILIQTCLPTPGMNAFTILQ